MRSRILVSHALIAAVLGAWFLQAARVDAQVREAEWSAPTANVTVSASEQFRIIGGTPRSRGTFASFAEQEKEEFLRLLGQETDAWHHLILIRLSGDLTAPPKSPSVDWNVNQFGNTFSCEIRVHLSQAFRIEPVRQALLHLLMFEMALRDIEVPVTDQLIPHWLRTGLPGALELRRQGRPSHFFRSMFRMNLITPSQEILEAKKEDADAVSRSVYAASASGFVLMLLDQPEGPRKLARLIHGFGGAHGAQGHKLVARYFPALIGTAERLEKQWVLYCSKLASPQVLEFLTPAQTDIALQAALQVEFLEFAPESVPADSDPAESEEKRGGFFSRFKAREGASSAKKAGEAGNSSDSNEPTEAADTPPTQMFQGTLDDFERFLARQDRAEILAPVRQSLLELGFRSFPLYRPLVNDYLKLLGDLLAGQTKEVASRLEALRLERERLTGLLANMKRFMDEYKHTQLGEKSGIFDAYLERIDEIQGGSRGASDPLSNYLDEVEAALKE